MGALFLGIVLLRLLNPLPNMFHVDVAVVVVVQLFFGIPALRFLWIWPHRTSYESRLPGRLCLGLSCCVPKSSLFGPVEIWRPLLLLLLIPVVPVYGASTYTCLLVFSLSI